VRPSRLPVVDEPLLVAVEVLAAGAEDALAVDGDDVLHALGDEQLPAGVAGRARARHRDGDVADVLADDLERVDEGGEHDDRGAVLVVVEDRDVELLAQPLLDLEAAGRGDVLEVDAAERRGDRLADRDDLVDVLRVEADREPVDAGEVLEERGLPLHDRHRRLRADVAEAEHGGPVGDDRDRVALDRQRRASSGFSWIAMQTRATPGV
jgi:hypothetical protein